MIDIKTKVHDNFSIEFKESFVVRKKIKDNLFAVNTWIFVPNSLDINPQTYGKDQFYRDIKSNVRMITPVFILRDIAKKDSVPFTFLENAMNAVASNPTRSNISDYEYQIKMFSAILKSSIRDEVAHILSSKKNDIDYLCTEYLRNLNTIITAFRELRKIVNVPTIKDEIRDYFSFGDEFISHISALYTYRILKMIDKSKTSFMCRENVVEFLKTGEEYEKSVGYPVVSQTDKDDNISLVYRHGILKKYVESDLFIKINKKKDGTAVEQLLYSIAAGVAMIFATIVSFSVQKTYGSLSFPLFFALIVSYMLKDRIKELMRYFFAHKLVAKYFDNKAFVRIKDQEVGWMKEGVDFITDEKTPKEVLSLRNRSSLLEAENKIFDEKIILYRKVVFIDSRKLEENNTYNISGINDIFRFHVNRFIQKMDNPEQTLNFIKEDGSVGEILSPKIYYLNFVIQVRYEDQVHYKRFRVSLTRNGIQQVQEF